MNRTGTYKRLNRPQYHIAFLWVAVLLVYAQTIDFGFMFDDYAHQEMLKRIKAGERSMNIFYFVASPEEVEDTKQWTGLPWWTSPKWRANYFRPIATLSHYMDYSFWDGDARAYHVMNVVWYGLLVTLLYFFFHLLCADYVMSFLGALIFALDECHYMTVLWPAARNEIFCAVFLLASFFFYIRSVSRGSFLLSACAVLFYVCALLSKELAILFPVLLIAYDLTRSDLGGLGGVVRSRWRFHVPLMGLTALYILFYKFNNYGSYWYGERLLASYFTELFRSTILYTGSMFYGLSVAVFDNERFYRYLWLIILSLIPVVLLLKFFWSRRKEYPEIPLFMLWIFLFSPLIVIPPINDRLLVVPSIGFAYLGALSLRRLRCRVVTFYFVAYGLIIPLVVNVFTAMGVNSVQEDYRKLHVAVDQLIPHKSKDDRLFFLNFPKPYLSSETYMYMALYFDLLYHYPNWGAKVFPLSAFEYADIEVLGEDEVRMSHPTKYYFETNTERLFLLDRKLSPGDTFTHPDMKVTIEEVIDGRVKSIVVKFQRKLTYKHYYFLRYNAGRWELWLPDVSSAQGVAG